MPRKLTALVIGNANYEEAGVLRNPANDAEDLAGKLEACGFTVIRKTDITNKAMDKAVREFRTALADQDVGLFFFAGHGVQIGGENYLVATDTATDDETEAKHSSLPLNKVIETMEKSGTTTNIIILDACRNNPWERAWHRDVGARGLAPVYAPKGTLIAFSTSPGQVASDGAGRNGDYTAALLQHLDTPDCSVETMFKRVRNTLAATTKQKQISWEHTSLAGEFYFNLSVGARITDYAPTALADGLFVVDEARACHVIIRGLKTHTWPRQNPALDSFDPKTADGWDPSDLFVLGRNIYQSACGHAHSAGIFLNRFMATTTGLRPEGRKALLDGMLFEVFFNPKGEVRRRFKLERFDPLFELQQHEELKPSFDFIAECLLPEVDQFHGIPGKGHEVAVNVTVTGVGNRVTSVYVGGRDIYWLEDKDYAVEPGEAPMGEKVSRTTFEASLSHQMVVPRRLLAITYNTPEDELKQLYVPFGYTARRRAEAKLKDAA
jgi:hypothetical protein